MVVKKPEPAEDPWQDSPERPVTVVKGSGGEYATITFKAGAGYNAPWIVFKPSSMEEAHSMVDHEDLESLLDKVARRNKDFERHYGGVPAAAKPAVSSGSWGNKAQAAPQASSDIPSGTCPTHNCDLVYVEPFKKRDGSEVSARVACPVPKCYAKTFWHNKDGSWTEK